MMPYFWQLAINPKLIFFEDVDSYAKIFLILYPHLKTPQPVLL